MYENYKNESIDHKDEHFSTEENSSYLGLKEIVDNFEREILRKALLKFNGNCSACARYLKITLRVFNYRVKALSLDPKNFKKSSK